MWGQDFILPPAFWPAFSGPLHDAGQKRAQRAPRQDEILAPLMSRAPFFPESLSGNPPTLI
jgi:hypothetical protein